MKRDWDLCREIMLALEDGGDFVLLKELVEALNEPAERVSYHCKILSEADLIFLKTYQHTQKIANPSYSAPPEQFDPQQAFTEVTVGSETRCRLTWNGHEFLDASRESAVWNWVKDQSKKLPGLTFAMLVPLMKQYIRKKAEELGLHLPE